MSAPARSLVLLVFALATVGCVRGCTSPWPPIHPNPNMDYQEKLQAQEESSVFYDGSGMRHPVAGTVARGELREDEALHTGKDELGELLVASPIPVDDALLRRGEERYAIYCQPCHDERGTGQGVLTEYAGVPTATFHDEQRRGYPDGQLFDVITNGVGLMPGYRYPIPVRDRWAIVAWVRQLQQERLEREAALAVGR